MRDLCRQQITYLPPLKWKLDLSRSLVRMTKFMSCKTIFTQHCTTELSKKERKPGINIVDSFKLPGDLPRAGLDIENLVPTDNGIRESTAGRVRRFSFAERLKGWKIKCTKRKSGSRTDKLYTHKNSVNFRSAVEVVTFILYEAYPSDRPPKREAQVNAEELMVDEEELMVDEGLFEGLEPLNGRVFYLAEV